MKHRPCYFTGIAVLAFCSLIAPAGATHVACGDVITVDTTLDSDIQCGSTQEHGLIIGAGDVTLRMAGHKITASAAGADTGSGIGNPYQWPPPSNIEIRNGAIEGFQRGVALFASDSTATKVTVTEGYFGIAFFGDRNYAHRNSVDLPTHSGPFGNQNGEAILFMGDDAYAWGNAVTGAPFHGIVAQGERPRIASNQIQGCSSTESGTGIHVDLYTKWAVINGNTVGAPCFYAIAAYAVDDSPGRARIRLNQVTGGYYGMYVNDPGAFVGRNTASGASQDGIHVVKPGTTVQNNTATGNGVYGIFGPVGTIDGGGNTASGNGATPQCVNVSCGP